MQCPFAAGLPCYQNLRQAKKGMACCRFVLVDGLNRGHGWLMTSKIATVGGNARCRSSGMLDRDYGGLYAFGIAAGARKENA